MNELYHYGVSKLDGSPGRGSGRYPLGSGKRPRSQNNKTVFISGSSKTQSKDSGYYRPLPKEIRNKIDGYIENGHKIIVGDAPGVDRQVQNYLNKKGYDNVEVYGPGKEVRYTANKKWKTNPIDAPEFEPNSKEWLAKKDIAMNDAADMGLAIVLDEGAKATRKNVQRLRDANKEVEVYELSKNGKANDKWIKEAYQKSNEIYNTLSYDEKKKITAAEGKPPEQYTNYHEYNSYLAKNFLYEIKDIPVSIFDIWREGNDGGVAVALMTRSGDQYRGKGYASKLVKQGIEWMENNPWIKEAYWDPRKDNIGSIRLAEKNGFEKVGEDGDWLQYKRTFKR